MAESPGDEQSFVDGLEGDQETEDEDQVEAEDESIEGCPGWLDHEEGHVHDANGHDKQLSEGFQVSSLS